MKKKTRFHEITGHDSLDIYIMHLLTPNLNLKVINLQTNQILHVFIKIQNCSYKITKGKHPFWNNEIMFQK